MTAVWSPHGSLLAVDWTMAVIGQSNIVQLRLCGTFFDSNRNHFCSMQCLVLRHWQLVTVFTISVVLLSAIGWQGWREMFLRFTHVGGVDATLGLGGLFGSHRSIVTTMENSEVFNYWITQYFNNYTGTLSK